MTIIIPALDIQNNRCEFIKPNPIPAHAIFPCLVDLSYIE